MLSELEGTVLGLIAREQPITAYRISKAFELSPVTTLSNSKGSIYPSLKRLTKAGFLTLADFAQGGRKGTNYEINQAGLEALKKWLLDPTHAADLAEDPLRSRIQSFELISSTERIRYLESCKEALRSKALALETYRSESQTPFHDVLHDSAASNIRSRIDWIQRTIERLEINPNA